MEDIALDFTDLSIESKDFDSFFLVLKKLPKNGEYETAELLISPQVLLLHGVSGEKKGLIFELKAYIEVFEMRSSLFIRIDESIESLYAVYNRHAYQAFLLNSILRIFSLRKRLDDDNRSARIRALQFALICKTKESASNCSNEEYQKFLKENENLLDSPPVRSIQVPSFEMPETEEQIFIKEFEKSCKSTVFNSLLESNSYQKRKEIREKIQGLVVSMAFLRVKILFSLSKNNCLNENLLHRIITKMMLKLESVLKEDPESFRIPWDKMFDLGAKVLSKGVELIPELIGVKLGNEASLVMDRRETILIQGELCCSVNPRLGNSLKELFGKDYVELLKEGSSGKEEDTFTSSPEATFQAPW